MSLQRGSIPTSPSTITQDQPCGYLAGVQGRRVPRSPHQPPGFAPAAGSGCRAQHGSSITAVALRGPTMSAAKRAAGLRDPAGEGQGLYHCIHGACAGRGRGAMAWPSPPALAAGTDPAQHQLPLPTRRQFSYHSCLWSLLGCWCLSRSLLSPAGPCLVLAGAVRAPLPCPRMFPDGSVRRSES